MNNLLLFMLSISLVGLVSCTGMPRKLTPEGNYADTAIKRVAKIQIVKNSTILKQVATQIKKSRLPQMKFAAGNCSDDTGTKTIGRGALLSNSGRQWVQYSLIKAGLQVATHGSSLWSKEVRTNVQNLGALVAKKSTTDQQKARAEQLLVRELQILLNQSKSPDFVVRCTWTKFDRNIKTGALGTETIGVIDDVAVNLGFKGRYQVASLGIQIEIVDNRLGLVIDSFELEKQIIAFERSFALFSVFERTGNDDIKVQATPVTRSAEATNGAQKKMVEQGVAEAIRRLMQRYPLS